MAEEVAESGCGTANGELLLVMFRDARRWDYWMDYWIARWAANLDGYTMDSWVDSRQ